MPPQTFILLDTHRRRMALRAVQMAPVGMQVQIGKPTRTTEQNGRLHALLADLAVQLVWPPANGELHDSEWWKRRMTLGWLLDKKQERWRPEIVTPLDDSTDEFAILLPHTSDLDVEQCASLNIWIEMFGSTNGVVFKEPERQPEPPPREYER